MNNLKDLNQIKIEEEVYYDKESMNTIKTKYLRNTLTNQEKKFIYSSSKENKRRSLRPENFRRASFYSQEYPKDFLSRKESFNPIIRNETKDEKEISRLIHNTIRSQTKVLNCKVK